MIARAAALALALTACAAPSPPPSPGARLVHRDGRPLILDAPLGLRRGQPLYVGPVAAARAIVIATAPDGPRRWRVAPLCTADAGATGAERAPALPDAAPVRLAPGAAARLGRCWARVAARAPDTWRPWSSRAVVTLDVGALDGARPGQRYALFGRALGDGRGQLAGFELRAVCRITEARGLTADCAVDRERWPDYGLPDWQRGGVAHPVDAPAAGDLLDRLEARPR